MLVPRFSSADSFVCRYSWLPKLVQGLIVDPDLFTDHSNAMVRLGVGSNMVNSIRFWGIETGFIQLVEKSRSSYEPSELGLQILGDGGFDPFIEDISTLLLIHWNISTQKNPLFAWDFMLNKWHRADFSLSEILPELTKTGSSTPASRKRHMELFLRTYVPTRGHKVEVKEDNLDSPLVELDFVRKVGERQAQTEDGERRSEALYSFRFEDKPEITPALFVYCIYRYWLEFRNQEKTLTFRDIATERFSIGQVFKLPEHVLRDRLEGLESDSEGLLAYEESASSPMVVVNETNPELKALLKRVYKKGRASS